MNKVLILYPSLFSCYSKFHRKIENIIGGMDQVTLIYHRDKNNLIKRYSDESQQITNTEENSNWTASNVTHAVIFDDGEEFLEEVSQLKECGVPVRYLKINITRVVNIKTDPQYNSRKPSFGYEYIGRGSYWGNPYSMHENGDDRDEVIRKYKYDFDYEKFINKEKFEVYKLAGKRLGCFCKPLACHGDVLAEYLNSWDDGL